MNHNLKYNFLLMLAALIWGSAFVAQSVGMDYLGPFSFNCVRSFMGSLVLLPVIWFMDRQRKGTAEQGGQKAEAETKETAQTEEEKYPKTNPFLWVLSGIGLAAVLAAGFYIRYKIVKNRR